MFENLFIHYLFILLGWMTQVRAAEQLFPEWTAFTKTKIKLLSAACLQEKLQDCSLMAFRYSNSGIHLKHLNQNVYSIMPHPIWTQDLGFTAKIHQLPNVQGCRCNPGWKVFLLNPRQQLNPRHCSVYLSPFCQVTTSGPPACSTRGFWEQLSVALGLNCKIWILNQQIWFISKYKQHILMQFALQVSLKKKSQIQGIYSYPHNFLCGQQMHKKRRWLLKGFLSYFYTAKALVCLPNFRIFLRVSLTLYYQVAKFKK